MPEAVLGHTFTFQTMFVDPANVPIAVNSPAITVYSFSGTGVRQVLASGAMSPAIPAEVGRYVYAYTIPTTFNDGDTVYGDMTGIDPVTLLTLRAEEAVSVISAYRGAHGYPGLVGTTVKGTTQGGPPAGPEDP